MQVCKVVLPGVIYVAPRAGAWVETLVLYCNRLPLRSHPVRVRGLKQVMSPRLCAECKSHPVRVRGLKQISRETEQFCEKVSRTPCGCVG